jgi:hypothetical protein
MPSQPLLSDRLDVTRNRARWPLIETTLCKLSTRYEIRSIDTRLGLRRCETVGAGRDHHRDEGQPIANLVTAFDHLPLAGARCEIERLCPQRVRTISNATCCAGFGDVSV